MHLKSKTESKKVLAVLKPYCIILSAISFLRLQSKLVETVNKFVFDVLNAFKVEITT